MSFNEMLAELESLNVAQRQILIRCALELDDTPLSPEHEALVAKRLAEHHRYPESSVSLDKIKSRLRSRFGAK